MSAVAGPSRGPDTWRPTKYLEPLHPDNEEVLEQAAYQAAVTKLGGDSRRMTRYKPRKAVDFQGGLLKWRMVGQGIVFGGRSRQAPGAPAGLSSARGLDGRLIFLDQQSEEQSGCLASNTPQSLRPDRCTFNLRQFVYKGTLNSLASSSRSASTEPFDVNMRPFHPYIHQQGASSNPRRQGMTCSGCSRSCPDLSSGRQMLGDF